MWWIAAAFAEEGPYNTEPQLQLAGVHVFGADQPWGARLGLGVLAALGDRCEWAEVDCPGGPVWPLGGAIVRADWRGGPRFGVEVLGELGLGDLDMFQMGFFPLTAGLLTAGPRFALDAPVGLAVGAQLQRAAAVDRLSDPNATSWFGHPALALTADVGTVLSTTPDAVRLAVGVQGSLLADSLD